MYDRWTLVLNFLLGALPYELSKKIYPFNSRIWKWERSRHNMWKGPNTSAVLCLLLVFNSFTFVKKLSMSLRAAKWICTWRCLITIKFNFFEGVWSIRWVVGTNFVLNYAASIKPADGYFNRDSWKLWLKSWILYQVLCYGKRWCQASKRLPEFPLWQLSDRNIQKYIHTLPPSKERMPPKFL